MSEAQDTTVIGSFFFCCNRTSQRILRVHRIFQCNQCETISQTKPDFMEHFQTHLERKRNIDIAKEATLKYHCRSCDLVLNAGKEVEKHRQKHEREVCKVCDTCGILFTRRHMWDLHQRKHEAEKTNQWYVCKKCNASFHYKKGLEKHLARHTAERPHVCEFCGKSFKQASTLARHQFIHSNDKPLSCEFCGKGFTSRYNLKGHLRTHTGEKPFKCDVCEAAFTHNVSLKTHKRSAHGIDVWKDQKSQIVEEFDDVNITDPKMYERQKVEVKDDKKETPSTSKSNKEASDQQEPSGSSTIQQVTHPKVPAKVVKRKSKKKVKHDLLMPHQAPRIPLDVHIPPLSIDAANYPPNVNTLVPLFNYQQGLPPSRPPQSIHGDRGSEFVDYRFGDAVVTSSQQQQQQTGDTWSDAVTRAFTSL